MRTYYVYIMASRSRVLYTGVTNDLERRTLEHKGRTTPGFTSRYNITRLVYFEELPDVRESDCAGEADQGVVSGKLGRPPST